MVVDTLEIAVQADTSEAQGGLQELVQLMQELVAVSRGVLTEVSGVSGNIAKISPKPVEQVTDSAKKQQTVLQGLRGYWKEITALIGGGALLRGIFDLTDAARDLQAASTAQGFSTRGLQTLQYAAEQSNVSVDSLNGAMGSLHDQMIAASMGDQGAMTNLGFLGLSSKSLQDLDAPERFSAVAEALGKIGDPARRTGVAMRVFGGAAKELGPLLEKSPDDLRALAQEFAALGGGLGSDQIKALTDWNAAMGRTRISFLTLRAMLAQTLLPVLKAATEGFGSLVRMLQTMQRNAKVLEFGGIAILLAGFMKLVVVLRTMQSVDIFKTVLSSAKWLGIAVLIAAVAAVVQDLVNAFRGGRSVIAEVIDKFAGLGTADGWVRNIKAGWEAMSKMEFPGITEVIDAMNKFYTMPELKGRIEGLREGISSMQKELPTATGFRKAALQERIPIEQARLRELEDTLFGVQGLRAVGRGLGSDAQRSGEMTTGVKSRFEAGPGSITVVNEINVEAAAGTREIAGAAQRGVEEAMKTTGRNLSNAVGNRR